MRKRFSESEIINLLRAIEVKISRGMGTEEGLPEPWSQRQE